MNTKTIITKSIKDAAIEAIAERANEAKVRAEVATAIAALDSLPKTPTGKDTKAVKEAKAKATDKIAEACRIRNVKNSDFGTAFRLGVIATNRMHACPANVDKVLFEQGFSRDDGLSGKCRETTVSIEQYNKNVEQTGEGKKQYDGRCKEHGQIYYLDSNEQVYVHKDGGADALHLVVRFYRSDHTYRITYFGYGPKLTAFGLAFFRNYCVHGMSTFDNNVLENLRVNFSSIGSEYGPEAVARLGALCTLVKVADDLMTKAPFVDIRNLCVEYDSKLQQAIADGKPVCFVRRTMLKNTYNDEKGRFNVVLSGTGVSELPLDAEHVILANVDLDVTQEYNEEEESE